MKRCPKCPEVYSDLMHFCPNDGNQLIAMVAADPLLNTTIDGKYIIEAVIGKGGMGVVYRARHTNFNRQFAIKVLKSDLVTDPQAVKRFRNEANAAGAIRHPNAIAITDFNITNDGIAYLVMDYVEGRSLREIVKKEGPQTYQRTVKLLCQVCDAVAAAHRKGIIHRDLKPDNIMVENTEDGEMVHVLDFGIAKLSQNPAYSENITVGGAILGSPYYMSPEQCDGRQLDPRSDIYSLGIILYELLNGKVPFRAQTPWGLVKMHCSTPPQPLRGKRPDIPPALEAAILKALAKTPNERQSSALELRKELESSLNTANVANSNYSLSPEQPQPSFSPPPGPVYNPVPVANQPVAPTTPALAQNIALPPQPPVQDLSTVPMQALVEAKIEAKGPSLEQQKLEELAKELEAEMSQFRGKKESTGGFKSGLNPSRSGTLGNMAQELSEELGSASVPNPPPPAAINPVIEQAPANNWAGIPPPPPPFERSNAARSEPMWDTPPPPSQPLPNLSNTDSRSSYTYEIDIAEEFSLALPEMVEDVLMGISEGIVLKADVIAQRAKASMSPAAQLIAAKLDKEAKLDSAKTNGKIASSDAKTPSRGQNSDRFTSPTRPNSTNPYLATNDEPANDGSNKKAILIFIGIIILLAIFWGVISFLKTAFSVVPSTGH